MVSKSGEYNAPFRKDNHTGKEQENSLSVTSANHQRESHHNLAGRGEYYREGSDRRTIQVSEAIWTRKMQGEGVFC